MTLGFKQGIGIVIAVAAIAAVAFVLNLNLSDRCRMPSNQTQSHMQAVATALYTFKVDRDTYPESLGDLIPKDGFSSPYLRSTNVLVDKWGTRLRYDLRNTGFSLRSAGADRTFDTSDDVVFEGK